MGALLPARGFFFFFFFPWSDNFIYLFHFCRAFIYLFSPPRGGWLRWVGVVPSFPRCSALKLSLLSPQVAEGSAGRELSPRKKPPSAASSAAPEEERCARRPPPEGAGSAAVGSEARPLERAAAGGWCRSCQAQLAELRRQAARLAAGGCPPNAPPVSGGCRLREGREGRGQTRPRGVQVCAPRIWHPGRFAKREGAAKVSGFAGVGLSEGKVPLRALCAGTAVGCRDKETEIRSDFDGGSGAAQRGLPGHGERWDRAFSALPRLWERTEATGGFSSAPPPEGDLKRG